MPLEFSTASLESATFDVGRELAARSAGLSPRVFDRRWWSNTLLQWGMKDERFKVQLFRFIDVLPALRDDAAVTRLAEEYFGDMPALTTGMQWGLRAAAATTIGARLGGASLRRQVHEMARMFIAGESPEAAVPALEELWRNGRASSVDLLGEATLTDAEADRYRDRCVAALRLLSEGSAAWPAQERLERDHLGVLPRISLSVKLSALHPQFDPIDPDGSFHAVAARLRPILDVARSLPAAITFDMEQAELKDLTLEVFMRLLSEPAYRQYPYAAIALQAYLKETANDLQRLLQWVRRRGAPIGIRLVKGAYWDSEIIRHAQQGWPAPVFASKMQTDAAYERLSLTLLEHADLIRPTFGTHNLRSLAHADAAAKLAGLPPEACEFQMIYGMAEPLQQAVAESGRRVRIYTPVGELLPGMAYLVRRLLENTSNESFLRKEYAEAEPLEVLLAPPHPDGQPVPASPADAESPNRFHNEPHSDFSTAAARDAMARAIEDVESRLGMVIAAVLKTGPTGDEVDAIDPSDGRRVVGRWRACTAADAAAAMGIARAAALRWRRTPPNARAGMLRAAATIMRTRRYELAAWEIFETGKPWREADADIAEAIDFLEFYANEMDRLGAPRRLGLAPGELNHLSWSPRGVAAVIAPWNFPVAIPTGMVSAALVTGNPVLFKPSERSTIVGHFLVETLLQAGVPKDVLHILPGGPEIGRALASSPDIDLIAFTGSKDAGLWILEQAGRTPSEARGVKHVIAEMGGKNAIIIDETADLDEAVAGVAASFTGYQGQKCSACSRVIVHEAVHDAFVQRLTEAVTTLRIGPAKDPATKIGPMIDARARENVRRYIAIGKTEGRLALERPAPAEGFFVGPAIFTDIKPDHRLAREEIFGPVLAVMRAASVENALKLANDSCYALTGGLYSRSPRRIAQAREEFDVGNLYVNRPITGALVSRQPFGGHRFSGVGTKAGGEDYLTQFMVARVVSENTLRRGFAPSERES
jgi:RHH-type transcriptional regulator, proline utilization regulon repressor / proline dehydrogenase / delta 1-pyrroline-5-carboxylate dehydrogenase